MEFMNKIEYEDIKSVLSSKLIDWNEFDDSSFLITGGTGLIGSVLTKTLLLRNLENKSNITIYLLVRDKNKAVEIFKGVSNHTEIHYIEDSVETVTFDELDIDYVVHTAAPTKSEFFVSNPVDTIDSIILGTRNILEFAKKSKSKKVINVTSMESYGTLDNLNVTEDCLGIIPLNSLRSSYPESKRMTELMGLAYSKQYNVQVCSVRLAQTFGAGITANENRVFKYFCDCIINEEDIVLKSTGETIINFCYLSDAIKSILILCLKGNAGEIYNVAGESYNMTIKNIAEWLIDHHGNKSEVVIDVIGEEIYAPVNKMKLNCDKIKQLGWEPQVDIKTAYLRLIASMTDDSY